jgi:hypothetical protein
MEDGFELNATTQKALKITNQLATIPIILPRGTYKKHIYYNV